MMTSMKKSIISRSILKLLKSTFKPRMSDIFKLKCFEIAISVTVSHSFFLLGWKQF